GPGRRTWTWALGATAGSGHRRLLPVGPVGLRSRRERCLQGRELAVEVIELPPLARDRPALLDDPDREVLGHRVALTRNAHRGKAPGLDGNQAQAPQPD